MNAETEIYIGDGVYAKFDGFAIELWTDRIENGRNWIVLEPMEFASLTRFWNALHENKETQ